MSDELRALARSLGDAAGRILAVQQENERLTAIVRDLAAVETPSDSLGCTLCIQKPRGTRPLDVADRVAHHDPACPWRRAVEWVRDTDQETT